jgi:hypothetical protein
MSFELRISFPPFKIPSVLAYTHVSAGVEELTSLRPFSHPAWWILRMEHLVMPGRISRA